MGFFDKIRSFIMNIFVKDDIKNKVGVNPQISDGMLSEIEAWRSIYGLAPIWKKTEFDKTISFAKTVCRDITSKVTVEATITTGDNDIDKDLKKITDELPIEFEKAIALGGAVARPYFNVDTKKIEVQWYSADRIVPLEWQGKELVSVSLMDFVVVNQTENKVYCKVESHIWNNGETTITSKAYKWEGERLGVPVPLDTVKEWENISTEPIVIKNLKHPLFTYMKTPLANNIDGSNIGISIFANAVDLIEAIDKTVSSMDWERVGGESKVFVSDSMIPMKKRADGQYTEDLSVFERKLYKKLDGGIENGSRLFEVSAPSLRFDQYSVYLNTLIALACKNMALDSKSFLVDKLGMPVTAEQILSEKNETYTTVLFLQNNMLTPALYKILDNIRALEILYSVSPILPENEEISISYGDSVMEDETTERKNAMSEVQAGVRSKLSYLMDFRNLTEEEAQKELERIKAEAPVIDMFGTEEGF